MLKCAKSFLRIYFGNFMRMFLGIFAQGLNSWEEKVTFKRMKFLNFIDKKKYYLVLIVKE